MGNKLQNGFTITEILVVIAIICLLVSLLLPVVFNAKEYAYLIYCQSEMRVLGQAYHAYANDYSGSIAIATIQNKWKDIFGVPRHVYWFRLLRPYGKAGLEDNTYADVRDNWITCPKYKTKYNSYAQNNSVGLYGETGSTIYPTKFSHIQKPSTTFLSGEAPYSTIFVNAYVNFLGKKHRKGQPTPHFGTYAQVDGKWKWYHGKANALFCDGHVEVNSWDNNIVDYEDVRPPYHRSWGE